MNLLRRLFTRKPSIYELRRDYFGICTGGDLESDDYLEDCMRRADKIAHWVLNGRTSAGASSSNRGRSLPGND